MTTPEYCTFDGDPTNLIQPYRPSVNDMGGAAFVNDDADPPIAEQNVCAPDINEMQELIVRACRMMETCRVDYYWSGSALTLQAFASTNDIHTAASFSTAVVSTGIYEITHPAATLPATNWRPEVILLQDLAGAGMTIDCVKMSTTVTRVRVYNASGAASNGAANFRLRYY
jgi:hypothetical protein